MLVFGDRAFALVPYLYSTSVATSAMGDGAFKKWRLTSKSGPEIEFEQQVEEG